MKAKHFLFILCAGILVFSCTPKEKTYTVNGSVPEGTVDSLVYVIDPDAGQIIDTVAIITNQFTFSGAPDTTVYRRIMINDKMSSIIIPEAGTIQVDLSDAYSMGGTNLNDQLSEYLKGKEKLYEEIRTEVNAIIEKHKDDKTELQKAFEINQAERKIKLKNFMEPRFSANTNNALGKLILEEFYMHFTSEDFDVYYQQLGDTIKNSKSIQSIYNKINASKRTAEGMKFTDFTIEKGNIDGTPASLADYVGKGKYVLVDFWASWCGPCIREVPVLAEVYKKYKGDKFEVLGVAVWEQNKLQNTLNAIEKHGIIWPQIVNAESVPTDLYGIDGIPHIILFGPDGTILARGLRGDALKAKIAEVMK